MQHAAVYDAMVGHIDNILPEGLTMSKMYMNGTVRSWLHYCAVRDGHGTLNLNDLMVEKLKVSVKVFEDKEGK